MAYKRKVKLGNNRIKAEDLEKNMAFVNGPSGKLKEGLVEFNVVF